MPCKIEKPDVLQVQHTSGSGIPGSAGPIGARRGQFGPGLTFGDACKEEKGSTEVRHNLAQSLPSQAATDL